MKQTIEPVEFRVHGLNVGRLGSRELRAGDGSAGIGGGRPDEEEAQGTDRHDGKRSLFSQAHVRRRQRRQRLLPVFYQLAGKRRGNLFVLNELEEFGFGAAHLGGR